MLAVIRLKFAYVRGANATKIYPALTVITGRFFSVVRQGLANALRASSPLIPPVPSDEKMEESQRFDDPKLRARIGTTSATSVAVCNKRPQSDCLQNHPRDLLSRARIIGHDQMPLLMCTYFEQSLCLSRYRENPRRFAAHKHLSERLSILLARDIIREMFVFH